MTKNERMLKKATKQLQEAQERARTRLYEIADVKEIVKDAQETLKKLDRIEKKYIQGINFSLCEALPASYTWAGESTRIEGEINKYGNIQEIKIYRETAPTIAGGGEIRKIECLFE